MAYGPSAIHRSMKVLTGILVMENCVGGRAGIVEAAKSVGQQFPFPCAFNLPEPQSGPETALWRAGEHLAWPQAASPQQKNCWGPWWQPHKENPSRQTLMGSGTDSSEVSSLPFMRFKYSRFKQVLQQSCLEAWFPCQQTLHRNQFKLEGKKNPTKAVRFRTGFLF